MNDVIPFPNANRSAGDVACEPLGIVFPRLYRLELPDRATYSLSPDTSPYPPEPKVNRALSLSRNDEFSAVVPRHGSMDGADAYLAALRDTGTAGSSDGSCKTDQGYFTLVFRPTKPTWPSQMIFYVAESSPLTRQGKLRYWERSVSITGRWYEVGMLHADPDR